MKYDDASWHYGGDFPKDLPPEAGGTHIGMFVAWCMLNGLAGDIHTEDSPEMLTKLRQRKVTPGQWFLSACDEKFTDEDLTEEGNKFASYYYSEDGIYLSDYENQLGSETSSLYYVSDSWSAYDSIAPLITRRFQSWRNPPKWWQLWRKG